MMLVVRRCSTLIIISALFFSNPQIQAQSKTGFSWLLDYAGKSTSQVIGDKRFKAILVEIVPEIKMDLGIGNSCFLKDIVTEFLSGPAENVIVRENRYVILSACRFNSCPEKAWLWFDLKEGIAVGALVHYIFDGNYSRQPSLLLFSTQVDGQSLTEISKHDLKNWLSRLDLKFEKQRWLGKNGTIEEVNNRVF